MAWRGNPALSATGTLMMLVLLATMVGLAADQRWIVNEPVWLKPAKFALSIAVYSFSLVWLMSFLEGRRRLVRFLAGVIAVALMVEEAIIALQAYRGLRSHFNVATDLDATLWTAMGGAIVMLWLANLVIAILVLRQRFANPVLARAMQFGVIGALVGMAVAFLMVQPTPEQRASLQASGESPVIGAHSVGVPDGEPGLPILGWSTTGGDVRVPHFVGLHALQLLPVIAWLLLRVPVPRLDMDDRARLMGVAGIGYLGLVAILTWQALRGQSFVAPDALTLVALLGLAAGVGLLALGIVLGARIREHAVAMPVGPAA